MCIFEVYYIYHWLTRCPTWACVLLILYMWFYWLLIFQSHRFQTKKDWEVLILEIGARWTWIMTGSTWRSSDNRKKIVSKVRTEKVKGKQILKELDYVNCVYFWHLLCLSFTCKFPPLNMLVIIIGHSIVFAPHFLGEEILGRKISGNS